MKKNHLRLVSEFAHESAQDESIPSITVSGSGIRQPLPDTSIDDRLARIKASLARIDVLMQELKKRAQYE